MDCATDSLELTRLGELPQLVAGDLVPDWDSALGEQPDHRKSVLVPLHPAKRGDGRDDELPVGGPASPRRREHLELDAARDDACAGAVEALLGGGVVDGARDA